MSVEITSSGSTARTLYFNTNDTGAVQPYAVLSGDAYYVDCWVQAKSTNTGLGSVQLVVQTNGSTVTALDSVTITSGNKGTWLNLNATYTVGSGVTTASFGVRLAASATTANDIFYVDDMLVREATLVQTTNNAAVNGFSGSVSTSGTATPENTATVANNVKSNIQQLSTQVTTLQNAGTGTSNSVTPISVDFTQAADASTLGTSWSQWATGLGTAVLGITSGAATLKGTITSGRYGYARYTTASSTNLHRVNLTVASFTPVGAVDNGNGTYSYPNAYIYLLGRVNSAQTQYVYAKMTSLATASFRRLTENPPQRRFAIGYVNGGGEMELGYLATGNGLSVGATYTLVCGTSSNATRTFQLLENGSPVTFTLPGGGTTTDVPDASSGSALNNNFTGMAIGAASSSYPAGTVSGFSAVDLSVPAVRGSGFRRSRGSTSAASRTSGAQVMPNSFFDTSEILTSDLTYDDSTNKLTVSAAGWYQVQMQAKLSGPVGSNTAIYTVLFKNGSVYSYGQDHYAGARSVTGNWIVYCNAGDYLQPGVDGVNATFSYVGESTNTQTFWSVAFLGNKAPT